MWISLKVAYAFVSAGATAKSNTSDTVPLNVAYPAGGSAGDLLVLVVRSNSGVVVITPSDVTTLIRERTTNGRCQVYAKLATGSESGNFTISTDISNALVAQCARFSGAPATLVGIEHRGAVTGSSATTGLAYTGLTITQDDCLVIVVGGKSNGANTFSVPAEMDAEVGEDAQGTSACLVWDYKIQTTATNLSGNNWTIGAGDTSAARSSVSTALLPGAIVGGQPFAVRFGINNKPIFGRGF